MKNVEKDTEDIVERLMSGEVFRRRKRDRIRDERLKVIVENYNSYVQLREELVFLERVGSFFSVN